MERDRDRPSDRPSDRDDAEETFTVAQDEDGATLLDLLQEHLYDVGTTDLKRLLRDRCVRVNDAAAAPDRALRSGDRVSVALAEADDVLRLKPRPLDGFAVLYEDDAALVCAKPAGVAVLGERGDRDAPFLAAVLHHLLEKSPPGARPPRPRVVHRIDKETSGAVLVAKTRAAMRELTAQFEGREVAKEYLALVRGAPLDDRGEIDLPIGPSGRGRASKMRTGGRDAKQARTSFEVAERFEGFTLLRASPHTGRQHQIRAHLEAIGYPLAVDATYGGDEALFLSSVKRHYKKHDEKETPLLGRLSLHAARITFRSPARSEPITVDAPLPRDFEVALKQLRKWAAPGKRHGPRPRREARR